eukprot:symbB.v1.2.027186.t1/scaffold2768.1/size73204/2
MLARRFLFVLASFYFDDALITDWRSSRGSGQAAMANLNKLLGTPFAAEKRQCMSSQGLFLGLDHDVSLALQSGVVTFWARERLEEKLTSIIQDCSQQGKLSPGVAAKIYGIANFLEQGIYGRIGCGGLHAIKERQYERRTDLTTAIQDCFAVLKAVLASRPCRIFPVLPQPCLRFCIASDAALEAPQAGTGGLLAVWLNEGADLREAFVADIPAKIYQWWTPGDKKIAQLELLMALFLYPRVTGISLCVPESWWGASVPGEISDGIPNEGHEERYSDWTGGRGYQDYDGWRSNDWGPWSDDTHGYSSYSNRKADPGMRDAILKFVRRWDLDLAVGAYLEKLKDPDVLARVLEEFDPSGTQDGNVLFRLKSFVRLLCSRRKRGDLDDLDGDEGYQEPEAPTRARKEKWQKKPGS